MNEDVLAFIDALDLPAITLVGHSMGAAVALLGRDEPAGLS